MWKGNVSRGQIEDWAKRISNVNVDLEAPRAALLEVKDQVTNWVHRPMGEDSQQAMRETARDRVDQFRNWFQQVTSAERQQAIWTGAREWLQRARIVETQEAVVGMARGQAESWYQRCLSSSWPAAMPGLIGNKAQSLELAEQLDLPGEQVATWRLGLSALLASAALAAIGAVGMFWLLTTVIAVFTKLPLLTGASLSMPALLALILLTVGLHQAAHAVLLLIQGQPLDLRGLLLPVIPTVLPEERGINREEFTWLAITPLTWVTGLYAALIFLIPGATNWLLTGMAINLGLSLPDVWWTLSLWRSPAIRRVKLSAEGLALFGDPLAPAPEKPALGPMALNFWRGFVLFGILTAGIVLALPVILRIFGIQGLTISMRNGVMTLVHYNLARHEFNWAGALGPAMMLGIAMGSLSATLLPGRPLTHGQQAADERAQIEAWLPGLGLTASFLVLGLFAAVSVPWTVTQVYRLLTGTVLSPVLLDTQQLAVVLVATVLLRCALQSSLLVALGMSPRLDFDPRSILFPLAAVPRRGSIPRLLWSLIVLGPTLGILAAALMGIWLRPQDAPWLLLVLSIHSLAVAGDIWTVRLVGLYPRDVRVGGPGPRLAIYSSERDRRRLRLGSTWSVWSNFLRAFLATLVFAVLLVAISYTIQFALGLSFLQGVLARIPVNVLQSLTVVAQSNTKGLVVSYIPLVMVAAIVGLAYTAWRSPRLLRW